MIVIWSPEAKESLKKIARYIFLTFGEKPTENFIEKILHVEKTLSVNPNIGPIELKTITSARLMNMFGLI